jgi:hypothetical protein
MNIPSDHPGPSSAGRHRIKVLRIVSLAVAGVGFAVLFAFVFGLVVKVLWNWLMPPLFGLTTIGFWQAFGIVLLAKLLFGGFGHAHRGHGDRFERHFRGHFKKHLGDEEACEEDAPFPGNGRKWRHFRQFWQEEGRAAFESYLHRMESAEEK